ncbi:MAG: hypothetical protein K0S53_1191 [Bacteroidetes bacterium]|jgi:predicted DNA-binding protein (MmcQ/YjbR family)|nr:hypothetical protein [Bacteroidota bacterium]MDF2451785.1 hypothetical protein [Bacteroidota bacterium]
MVSVDHFIKIALSFDSAEQQAHFDKPSFRVNKKIFATLDIKTQKVVVKLSEVEQSVFSAYDQTIIYPVKGTWGKQGWTEVELKKVRKSVLNDLLKTSYQNVAPKKSLNKLNKKPAEGIFSQLSAPAQRALDNAGIKTIVQLSKKTEEDLLSLHGMGPGSLPKLRDILKTNGLALRAKDDSVREKKSEYKSQKEVSDYIQKLKSDYREILQALREIILKTDQQIGEQIKWNAPSFYYTGEMKAFDPKEYKRDLIVTNLRQKDHILLIFPTGAKLNDTSGLLEGEYKDGRRMMKIYDLKDLKSKEKNLQTIIKKWISLINT